MTLFEKIIAREIPGAILYEDDICIAFLDISQMTKGHTLIVPKKPYVNYLECDTDTIKHLFEVIQSLTKNYQETLGATGFNILSNMNEVAGQTVMHFHIHLIPRYSDDNYELLNIRSSKLDLEAIVETIKKRSI